MISKLKKRIISLLKKAIAYLDAIAAQRCKELGDLAHWISLLSLD
jgi:hypothetical protein